MRVSLFVTCLVDQMWASVGASTVEVLRRAGCDVEASLVISPNASRESTVDEIATLDVNQCT